MRMLKILINNIKRMLTKKSIHFYKYQITNDSSRILFFFDNNDLPEALEVLEKSFGVYSFSPALRTSNNLKNITDRALEVSQSILKSEDTFAIRVKRSGKHNYSSLDVAKLVGKAVLENFSTLNLKVNLTKPNKIIFIEIRDDFSYIFTEIIKSKWGGLPIETRKKIIVMDVGRIEDLLSGFLLMRRGCLIYPILFKLTNNREFNDIIKSNWKQ